MPSAEINNVWASQAPVGTVELITLPSGQTVKARKIAVQDLVLAGVISETDALSEFVQRNHLTSGRVKPDDAMKAAMNDPKQFGNLMMLVDRVVPQIVVEPTVRLHLVDLDKPNESGAKTQMIPTDQRQDGAIYTDQIPVMDKVHLINWAVGGVAEAVSFREEPPSAVATVADVASVPDNAQRPVKPRRRRR